jgi:uncharacterized protein (TIGR03663 family)
MSRKKAPLATESLVQDDSLSRPKAHLIVGMLLLMAAILRLWDLEIKPPHFDEGINGWFAHQMQQTGYYQYNHENFHGPLYFYLVYMFQTFFGSELFSIRLPAVIGSMLIVWGLLLYQPIFGRWTAWLAALCAAVSPGQIFYGRYSIHESWFAASLVFTLLGLVGLWKYGTKNYLWILVLGIVTAVCLKETYLIHFGCMAIAFLCCWWYTVKWRREKLNWAVQTWTWHDLRRTMLVGGFIFLALYSGLFMNWSGVGSFFQGLTSWIGTGVSQKSGHEKAWYYWFWLLTWYEQLTLLGLIFVLRFLWTCDVRMRYLAIYALGTFLAYSIIAYKTPWCIIAFQWPFFLIASYMVASIAQTFPLLRWVAVAIMFGPLFIALPLNWVNHSNPKEPYAYVTTSTRIWDGIQPLLELSKQNPRFRQLKGFVALESYYPVPWLLHQFTDVGYGPYPLPAGLDFAIVEASKTGELSPEYQSFEKTIFQIRDGQTESALLVRPGILTK